MKHLWTRDRYGSFGFPTLGAVVWLLAAATAPAAAPVDAGARPQVRRLTHSQYNNTVRDLLGDETRPADEFPPEDFLNGFKNQTATQDVSPLLAAAYDTAAERLARNAFAGGEDSHHLIPCQPRGGSDSACAQKFVSSFGAKAFRRPLTGAEVARYQTILLKEAQRGGQFLRGAQLVIEAMLQSPKFLFRLETGAYKTASDLSYFLWDTMPDDRLFQAAASGALDGRPALQTQAERMLQDPKARQAVDEFTAEWLRFDQVLNTVKDRNLYPQFNLQLAMAMTEETRRLVSSLVWGDGNFMDLFRADYAFLNSDLATLYRLPAPANEFEKVRFPADSQRAGVLGEAAFLAMTAKPGETSPTIRGLFIRSQFLCQQVPDPPPGVNSSLPPIMAEKPMTNRERLTVHRINKTCAGCHSMMDPIGFGFEKFDAIGQFQEKQTVLILPPHGDHKSKPVRLALEIDPSASVNGIANSNFSSPKELGRILAGNPACQECMVRQLFRYAFGRHETGADDPLIQQGAQVFRGAEFRWKQLLLFFANAIASEGKS
jgi:hypothetical protein